MGTAYNLLRELRERGVKILHEVPHDPGGCQVGVVPGVLVTVLSRAEHQLGLLTVVTGAERSAGERERERLT